MENKIYLRFVEDEDFDDLLNWRNDESTRKSAFNTHLVSEEEHSKWFNDVINNPLKNQFIIMDQNQNKIGQIRFDRDSNNMYNCLENRNTSPGINLSPEYAEIDITISPDFRNKGFGFKSLNKSCSLYLKNFNVEFIVAKIKNNNLASLKAFEKSGFKNFLEFPDYVELRLYKEK
ncbi:GNAT family N-acetyltransferase [archaeon]|jgi:UDP-2,4-diacetamido-2,4,6-trideoxy-beta-L-altropyranose hydrolase|nr:GNAT family N-acetyltransferase [archaeon]MBT3451348.1 GNAT family N-acetyltransferase [archaeon]MBT6869336.1 GNAT family N-acetyltransferase [archaeon]MBT7192499.1 GNAT family N-acetyltransferase [archaeon]MBT7380575.1 GNAT family N-acetyltransferase [archaeon]